MSEIIYSVGIDIGTSSPTRAACGDPEGCYNRPGGSEFHPDGIPAERGYYGLTPAPQRGAPVVEVPQ